MTGIDLTNNCIFDSSPEAWAKSCRGINCISILADGTTPHGEVRFDSPGSMHPRHYARLLYAPAGMRDDDEISAIIMDLSNLRRTVGVELYKSGEGK